MRILALETSTMTAGVAALQSDQVLASAATEPGERSAKHLAPLAQQILRQVGWQPGEVQLVAVTQGPGSFTGLRVGATMAKLFAWAVSAELIGVNTLAVLAAQAAESGAARSAGRIVAVMDAQRQELYTAIFSPTGEASPAESDDTRICDQATWLSSLQPGDLVTGPGLKQVAKLLPAGIAATGEELWSPTAAMTGQLAWQLYEQGARHDLWTFTPRYHRRSAAEEKRDNLKSE